MLVLWIQKIYSMNNTIVIIHFELFIYFENEYLGSFYDVNILQKNQFLQPMLIFYAYK
jgi:hypothetical protein